MLHCGINRAVTLIPSTEAKGGAGTGATAHRSIPEPRLHPADKTNCKKTRYTTRQQRQSRSWQIGELFSDLGHAKADATFLIASEISADPPQ